MDNLVKVGSPLAGLALLVAAGTAAALDLSKVPGGRYAADPNHSLISFTYTHLGFSHPVLRFDDADITLDLDREDVTRSRLEATIDASSIDTGVSDFDAHLMSDDFFNVTEYPTVTFVARSIENDGDDGLVVKGDLTMKGMTHPVTFEGQVNGAGPNPINEKPTIGVSLRSTVQRSQWDLGKYVPAVSDEVTIMLEVEMQKQ